MKKLIHFLLFTFFTALSFLGKSQTNLQDSLALVALYNATGGTSWTNSWDLSQPVDTWHGVTLNTTGHVILLYLDNNGLTGAVPTEITNLPSLSRLKLENNQLTSLPDLSPLSSLTQLYCHNNQLTSLPGLSSLSSLAVLYCSNNPLASLPDLSQLSNLASLWCNNTQLTSLPDLSSLSNLQTLYCAFNQLSSFPDLSSLSNLRNLWCRHNELTSLPDLSLLTNLRSLSFDNNQLTSLPDLSTLSNLTELSCQNNQLTSLPDLSTSTNLTSLQCHNNQLTALPDLLALTNLTRLFCPNNQLTNLPDLSTLSNLTELSCYNNQLTNLPDLSHAENLTILQCHQNLLTSLPNFPQTNLTNLRCSNNQLTSLPDLSQASNLTILWCSHNQLTSLPNLSALTNLTILNCEGNQLTSLPDLSQASNLTNLSCHHNQLTSLPDLSHAPNLTTLWCQSNQLTSLPDLHNPSNLTSLRCHNNQLTSLPDLSHAPNLADLECQANQLTSLPDLHNPSNLTRLWCSHNQLTSLPDLSQLPNLTELPCHNNALGFGTIEAIISHPNYPFDLLNYAPQNHIPFISGPNYKPENTTVSLTTPWDGTHTIYRWFLNDSLVQESQNLSYTIDALGFEDVGNYTVEPYNNTITEIDNFVSEPHYLNITDPSTGIVLNQIIIEFHEGSTEAERLLLREQYQAVVRDDCNCADDIELWELPWAYTDTIIVDIAGDKDTLFHTEQVKIGATCRNELDEVEYNVILNQLPVDNDPTQLIFTPPPIVPLGYNFMDSIVIALLDSGIDPALIDPQYISKHIIACSEVGTITDHYGHGTHMAKIITTMLDQQLQPRLDNIKITGDNGEGTLFDGICGLYKAKNDNAKVINTSWGYYGYRSVLLENILRKLGEDTNTLVICSAGNSCVEDAIFCNNDITKHYPSGYCDSLDNIVSVAALNGSRDDLSDYSSSGKNSVQLAAPGTNVNPAPAGGHQTMSGTSQATAFVTRFVLSYLSKYPNADYLEVIDALQQASTPLPQLQDKLRWGSKLDFKVQLSSGSASCVNCSNGTITVDISGGVPPYALQLDNGIPQTIYEQGQSTVTGLATKNYNIMITDDLGWQLTDSIQVSETPYAPCTATLNIEVIPPQENGDNCQHYTFIPSSDIDNGTINYHLWIIYYPDGSSIVAAEGVGNPASLDYDFPENGNYSLGLVNIGSDIDGMTCSAATLQPIVVNCSNIICADNLLFEESITSGAYPAQSMVRASGLVPAGEAVILQAGESILLEAGFEVEINAELNVTIEDCPTLLHMDEGQ